MRYWLTNILGLCLISISGFAHAINTSNGYNLPIGVTSVSREIYDLHMIIFYVCVVIGVLVFGAMAYSIINHRKSLGVKPAQFHESTTIELIWTIIPLAILVVVAIPATSVLIDLEDSSKSDMSIKVTGYQWKWKYDYLDGDAQGISFFSNLDDRSRKELERSQTAGKLPVYKNYLVDVDNELVVPINKKIRFLITSNDVIHAWWVPDFGVKQDAIPGFINDTWAKIDQPGVYRGNCAELCGKDHAFMPVVVRALTEEDYAAWIYNQKNAAKIAAEAANKTFTKEELINEGKLVYARACAACHQAGGQGVPGVFPAITASPLALGPIDQHLDIILNGKSGTAMQAFRDQLTDVELAAVVSFQRNGLGNNVGDFMQPNQVKAKR